MADRILICFPVGDAPGLRAEAAQLALGLAAGGCEVLALGPLAAWRHALRLARITAVEFAVPGDERKLLRAIQEYEPQVIHAFGLAAAHLVLPLTPGLAAVGVATLGHEDLLGLHPAPFRTAAAVFVPCEHLRDQLVRRLPQVPVVVTGHLMAPPEPAPAGQAHFLAEELGIEDHAPVVLLADRMDGGPADVARAMIDAVPLMVKRVPAVQVVIAGDGPRLAELEQYATAMNTRLGRRAVLLPGQREDMPRLLELATVAVGSGRFAAEAMAAGVAVVAAGAAGMLGTCTEDTLATARATCWARHGRLEPVTVKGLASEIVGLLAYADYRRQFAANGQAAVLAESARASRVAQIATYYARTASVGPMTHAPRRITAILPDELREFLFTLTAISGLRARFPEARVTLVAAPAHRGLLLALGLAETVLARPQHLREWPAMLAALLRARSEICLAFPGDIGSNLLAGCSLAPHRLGFADSSGSLVLSDHLHARALISPARAVLLAQALGVTEAAPLPALSLPSAARDAAQRQVLAAGILPDEPLLLLCPQAEGARAWPRQHWETLLCQLQAERRERIAVLAGGGVTLPAGVVALAPPADTLQFAALLARASLVIAADAGALHLADLAGVPCVGIYGPTAPDVCCLPHASRIPLCRHDLACHPCGDAQCADRRCLQELTPAEVAATVASRLAAV